MGALLIEVLVVQSTVGSSFVSMGEVVAFRQRPVNWFLENLVL